MKSALLNRKEPGRVCDVVEKGKEFPVAEDFYWIDCPDDVTTNHRHEFTNNIHKFNEFDILSQQGFIENGYKVARGIAYKSIGDQLDMIYKELQNTGNLSSDGVWASHITSVKQAIPKDNPEKVLEWIRANPPQ